MSKNDPLVACPRGCGTWIAQSLAESGKPHTATKTVDGELVYFTCS